jgi:hypothetical protein
MHAFFELVAAQVLGRPGEKTSHKSPPGRHCAGPPVGAGRPTASRGRPPVWSSGRSGPRPGGGGRAAAWSRTAAGSEDGDRRWVRPRGRTDDHGRAGQQGPARAGPCNLAASLSGSRAELERIPTAYAARPGARDRDAESVGLSCLTRSEPDPTGPSPARKRCRRHPKVGRSAVTLPMFPMKMGCGEVGSKEVGRVGWAIGPVRPRMLIVGASPSRVGSKGSGRATRPATGPPAGPDGRDLGPADPDQHTGRKRPGGSDRA